MAASFVSNVYSGLAVQAKFEREQLADEFFEVLDDIHTELRGVRNEIVRQHQIDEPIAVERDPHMWLNWR